MSGSKPWSPWRQAFRRDRSEQRREQREAIPQPASVSTAVADPAARFWSCSHCRREDLAFDDPVAFIQHVKSCRLDAVRRLQDKAGAIWEAE